MIERPLMTPDELKSLPKGTFVVMKTGFYPMKVKLKLFFKWGIQFEEKYEVMENGNRKVYYANRSELFNNIIQTYCPHYLEQPVNDSDFDEASGEKKHKNENLKTSPNAEQADSENTIDSEQEEEPTEEPEYSILDQLKNLLVLLPFRRSLRSSNKVVRQSFFLAIMCDLNLRFACHCPGCIKYGVAVFINYGSFGTSEIIFQIQRYATVFQRSLFQFWIIFCVILQLCHIFDTFVLLTP